MATPSVSRCMLSPENSSSEPSSTACITLLMNESTRPETTDVAARHALSLEEPDAEGGLPGRGRQRDVQEAGGQLHHVRPGGTAGAPAPTEAAIACVSRGSCATTNPDDQQHDRRRFERRLQLVEVEPGEVSDDRAGGEQEERRLDDAAERDAAELRQVGSVDAGGLGGRLAQRLDVRPCRPWPRRAGRAAARRPAGRAASPQLVLAQGFACARDRGFGAGQGRQADQQLGVVRVDQVGVGGGRRVGEIGQCDASVVAQSDRPRREAEVGDARCVKRTRGPPGRRGGRRHRTHPSRPTRTPLAVADQHQDLIGALLVAGRQHAPHGRAVHVGQQRVIVSCSSPGTRADASAAPLSRYISERHGGAAALFGDVSAEELDEQPVAPGSSPRSAPHRPTDARTP